MTDEIQIISESILSFEAKPCFCTIVPCSLKMWNETRLEQHKTSFLLHHTQYEDMQTNLITVICNINKYIISLNTQNKMYTPYIADTVISHCGPKKAPRVHYNRLKDGIHPTSNLRTMWNHADPRTSKWWSRPWKTTDHFKLVCSSLVSMIMIIKCKIPTRIPILLIMLSNKLCGYALAHNKFTMHLLI